MACKHCGKDGHRYFCSHECRILGAVTRTDGGCWNHQNSPNRWGYVRLTLLEFGRGGVLAHRLSYLTFNGPIPSGQIVRHKCDNPRCCNPEHLELGDGFDNARDCVLRGRRASGSKQLNAKLSREDARAIFLDPRSMRAIAKDYGIAHPQVINIKKRKSYMDETADLVTR